MDRNCLVLIVLGLFYGCALTQAEKSEDTLVETDLDKVPAELAEFCQTAPCRENTHFELKMKDGSYFKYESAIDPPVIQPDIVTIYPGEEIFIEAEVDDGQLMNMTSVSRIAHPGKTIAIKFSQASSVRDGAGMMLRVQNPFSKFLKYQLLIMTVDSEELQYTSSCPVVPGKVSYELWPYPIFQVLLMDMQLIDIEGDRMLCE